MATVARELVIGLTLLVVLVVGVAMAMLVVLTRRGQLGEPLPWRQVLPAVPYVWIGLADGYARGSAVLGHHHRERLALLVRELGLRSVRAERADALRRGLDERWR